MNRVGWMAYINRRRADGSGKACFHTIRLKVTYGPRPGHNFLLHFHWKKEVITTAVLCCCCAVLWLISIYSRVSRDSTPRFVCPSVGRSDGPSFFTFFHVFAVFGLTAPAQMLKRCLPTRDLGSRVSGLVSTRKRSSKPAETTKSELGRSWSYELGNITSK